MNGRSKKFSLRNIIDEFPEIKDKIFILENVFNEDLVGEEP